MGFFEFTWPHPAGEVLIAGTFNEWKGDTKLCKNESGLFTALVDLGDTEKVYYKYIVDGHWTVNYDGKREYDNSGNENNVLYPEDWRKEKTPAPSIKEKTPAPSIMEPEFTIISSLKEKTPAPSIKEKTPAPSIMEPEFTIINSLKEKTPAPSIKEKTPAPSIKERSPAPSIKESTPAPSIKERTPAPSIMEPENQPPAINTSRCVSPAMSPLTTPAAPTTHVYTVGVPGATFNSIPKTEPAPSTRSSSASSHESHNEKRELFREKTPEKKKEKRRSVILGRILNLFK